MCEGYREVRLCVKGVGKVRLCVRGAGEVRMEAVHKPGEGHFETWS